ncbi:MAG: tetratricopeptide repeat protein [Candidatus Dependentiae bacterium]
MNFIKKAVLSLFLINALAYAADPQAQISTWKVLPFPAIKVAEGDGQIKQFERVDLNAVDGIARETFKKMIAEQWEKKLPWVLAATLDIDAEGKLWRSYFDAYSITRWLLNNRFQRIAGRRNPLTGRPIVMIDYFSINRSDKKFKHIGTLAQLVKNDPPKVRLFLQAAKEGDNPDAMLGLGLLLEKDEDIAGAKEWYKKSADLGNPDAMNNLGVLLAKDKDIVGAKEWWQKAADLGSAVAMLNLGHLLVNNKEVVEAKEWYKKSAGLGNAVAMNNLGALLAKDGEIAEAKEWLKKAADLGNAVAMRNLGILLKKEGDIEGAKEWLKKSADLGNTNAMINLRNLLADESQEDEDKVPAKKRARID